MTESWINDGEKYGMVGLEVKTEGPISRGAITSNLSVLTDTAFSIPQHWRNWLGSIRAGEVQNCNLFLISKSPSSTPDILDEENDKLRNQAWNFYVGLLLASTFAPAHAPVLVSGVRLAGQIDIRQQRDLSSPIPCIFRPYPLVQFKNIQLAANMEKILTFRHGTGGWWSLAVIPDSESLYRRSLNARYS